MLKMNFLLHEDSRGDELILKIERNYYLLEIWNNGEVCDVKLSEDDIKEVIRQLNLVIGG